MDKEKALKIWLPVIADGVKKLPECKESLEMAIKALENQKSLQAELEEIKAKMIEEKCKHCDIDSNIQKCHEDNFTICDVYDILVIINEHIKKLEKI